MTFLRNKLRANLDPKIVTLADEGVPFAKVPTEHHDVLIEVPGKYARNADFLNNLDLSPRYKKVALTKEQLLKLLALWTFSPSERTHPRPYAVFHGNPGEGPKDPEQLLQQSRIPMIDLRRNRRL